MALCSKAYYDIPKVHEHSLFAYKELGVMGNKYIFGETCFSGLSSLRTSTVVPISIFRYDSFLTALKHESNAKSAQGNYILPCYFIDDENPNDVAILVPEIVEDLTMWSMRKFHEWKNLSPRERKSWWKYIESDFKTIFRHVLMALRSLYKGIFTHGNLTQGIVCINGFQWKLAKIEDSSEVFEDGVRKDLQDLLDLMRGIIDMPLSFMGLNSQIPADLNLFFHEIEDFKDGTM